MNLSFLEVQDRRIGRGGSGILTAVKSKSTPAGLWSELSKRGRWFVIVLHAKEWKNQPDSRSVGDPEGVEAPESRARTEGRLLAGVD